MHLYTKTKDFLKCIGILDFIFFIKLWDYIEINHTTSYTEIFQEFDLIWLGCHNLSFSHKTACVNKNNNKIHKVLADFLIFGHGINVKTRSIERNSRFSSTYLSTRAFSSSLTIKHIH